MLGGMLAGHTESGGEIIEKNGKKFKLFYGMSSATAMEKHAGGVAEYRSVVSHLSLLLVQLLTLKRNTNTRIFKGSLFRSRVVLAVVNGDRSIDTS